MYSTIIQLLKIKYYNFPEPTVQMLELFKSAGVFLPELLPYYDLKMHSRKNTEKSLISIL